MEPASGTAVAAALEESTARGCTNPPGHVKTLKIILNHKSRFAQAPTCPSPTDLTQQFYPTVEQVQFELVSLSKVINPVLKAPSDSLPPLGNLFQ